MSCDAGKMRWMRGVAGEEEWGEARRFRDSKNEGHAGAVDHVLHHMQRLRSAHPPSAFIRRRATFIRTCPPASLGMKETRGRGRGHREEQQHTEKEQRSAAQRPSPVQQRARKGTDKEELPEEGASGGNLHAPHHPVYGTAMPAFAIGGVVDTHAKHRASHANHRATTHANHRTPFLFYALPLPIPEPRRLVWAQKGDALAPGAQTPIPRISSIEEARSKYIGQVLPRVTLLQLPCPKRSACPCMRAHARACISATTSLSPKP